MVSSRLRRSPDLLPIALLAVAIAAAAVLLICWAAGLTFFQDTWAFLMHRADWSPHSLFQPHNEHIVVLDVVIQKLLLEIFGMTSAMPEFVVMTILLSLAATLLFVYVRRRAGAWPALFAAVLLLFAGPAWQVLLWPFEMVFVGSIAAGIAMLLALDREDRRGDVLACVALVVCFGFSTLGISFALAAIVEWLLAWRRRGWRRAWVWVVPLFLFALWYLGWGHTAEKHVTPRNVLHAPEYLAEGVASSLSTLLGTSNVNVLGQGSPGWGWAFLLAVLALVGWGLVRRHRFSASVLPSLVALVSFWLLAGANYIVGREAISSRYAYAGGALVLLVLADLLKGVRLPSRRWTLPLLALAGVVALAAAVANLSPLREGRDLFREQTVFTRSDLAAMEIAHRTIAPSFELAPELAGTGSLIDVFADEYFPVRRDHGSPAYDEAELAAAAPFGRKQADIVLSRALPIATETLLGARLPSTAGCTRVPPHGRPVPIGPGTTRVALPPGPHADFALGRFAVKGEFPVVTEGARGDSVTKLKIPADTSPRPWQLKVASSAPAWVCPPK